MSRFFTISVIIGLAVIGSGCKSFVEKKRNVLVVLIDYSASSDELTLDGYIGVVTDIILPHLNQFDCLTIVPIDEGAKISPVKLINEDLFMMPFSKHSDGFSHAEDSVRRRLSAYVANSASRIKTELKNQRVLRRKYTSFTDIVGGIHQTTNLIEITEQGDAIRDAQDFVVGNIRLRSQNTIVILSDMIQDSRELNFNKRNGITKEETTAWLARLKNQQVIPDLTGCNVFVIGATGRNSTQVDNIRHFWQEYFKEAKANLHAYGFNVDGKLKKYLIESRN